jgi:hypothetical protein
MKFLIVHHTAFADETLPIQKRKFQCPDLPAEALLDEGFAADNGMPSALRMVSQDSRCYSASVGDVFEIEQEGAPSKLFIVKACGFGEITREWFDEKLSGWFANPARCFWSDLAYSMK